MRAMDAPTATLDRRFTTRRPRSLGEYLTWMRDHWNAEMPTDVHTSGVWRDRVSGQEEQDGKQAVGGSLLGSPRLNEGFRRLLEASPFETEHAVLDGHQQIDPHYVRPIRAAIARIGHRRPRIALWLMALAWADFDWRGLVERRGWKDDEGELMLEGALYLLWREFDIAPRTRY
jgi:hypothetical protein